MSRYIKPLAIMLSILALGYLFWPVIAEHTDMVRLQLINFKTFCRLNPWAGYFIYAGILSFVLLAGLPVSTLVMLMAGVLYSFWEAATLVTVCRLLAAAISFLLARQMLEMSYAPAPKRAPYLLRKFESHPNMGLFLARLAPIPDSVINYTLAASPIKQRDYVVVSLLGMIPFTLFCVWTGQQMGSISHLIQMIQ